MRIDALRLGYRFRGHEVGRADNRTANCGRGPEPPYLNHSKIQHLDYIIAAATARQHDVCWFNVPMDQSVLMSFAQRPTNLAQDVNHTPLGLRSKLPDQLIPIDTNH